MAQVPLPRRGRRRRSVVHLLLAVVVLTFLASHSLSFLLSHANAVGRRCASASPLGYSGSRMRIAMVSLSEDRAGPRSFRGVMEAVAENKRAYARRMGYDFIDAGSLVDRSRPPNWSKIVAVRAHLHNYDWVFWNDADTIVANPLLSLEDILASVIGHSDFNASPDLVLTEDTNGVNSGVFFFRRSKWSEAFLDEWWNQTSYIRFRSTKSGDNAAMKHLIDSLSSEEMARHVRVSPMQCLFNSYPWSFSLKSVYRFMSSPRTVWNGVFSRGDFMVHLAGLDDKKKWVTKILDELHGIESLWMHVRTYYCRKFSFSSVNGESDPFQTTDEDELKVHWSWMNSILTEKVDGAAVCSRENIPLERT